MVGKYTMKPILRIVFQHYDYATEEMDVSFDELMQQIKSKYVLLELDDFIRAKLNNESACIPNIGIYFHEDDLTCSQDPYADFVSIALFPSGLHGSIFLQRNLFKFEKKIWRKAKLTNQQLDSIAFDQIPKVIRVAVVDSKMGRW